MEIAIESFEDMEVRIANLSEQEQIEEHRKYFALKVAYNKTKKSIERKEAYLNSPMADEIRSNNAIDMNEEIAKLGEDIQSKEMKLSVAMGMIDNKIEKDKSPEERTLAYWSREKENVVIKCDEIIQKQVDMLAKKEENYERELDEIKEKHDKKRAKLLDDYERSVEHIEIKYNGKIADMDAEHQRGINNIKKNIEGSRSQKQLKEQDMDSKIQRTQERIDALYDKHKDPSILKLELEIKELEEKKREIQTSLA